MAVVRDARRALKLPRERWRHLGRAFIELAFARLRLGADHKEHLLESKTSRRAPVVPFPAEHGRLVEQVAFAIPRVAHRVPWRADCLVQALAGERWLRRRGIAAQIVIGVRKDGHAAIEAHAWLEAGGLIVTGGDVAPFAPLAD